MQEYQVYHVYKSASLPVLPEFTVPEATDPPVEFDLISPRTVTVSLITSKLTLAFAVVGIAILLFSYGPSGYFWIKGLAVSKIAGFRLNKSEVQNIQGASVKPRSTYQPPFNPKLPKTNRVLIPSIGVKTDIEEATVENYEEALKKGVWRVSDFGAPSANQMPTILAAHRFGYLAWSNSFRHLSSFYNLPKLKVGDIVEIDWNQRKYMYEIYAEATGSEITDYTADLILYTCVDLTSEERIFKYGRLMEI